MIDEDWCMHLNGCLRMCDRGPAREITRALLASAALLGLLTSLPTAAQTETSDQSQLETIIVTAQRRAERLQDVPITVTNLSSEQLTQANVVSTSDIAKLTPGLRYDTEGPFVEPTIRGIGTQLIGQTVGSNVGTYVDGFYLPSPLQGDFQLIDIDNIQVLKGPQGTLFGRNTNGGAILINTLQPSTTTAAVAEASYGNYNAQDFKGYFTTGITDKIAWDIVGDFNKGDGYVKDISTGSDTVGAYENWTLRTGLKAEVTEAVSVLFRYQYQSVDNPIVNLYEPISLNGVPATLAAVIPGSVIPQKPNEVSGNYPLFFDGHSDSFQLTTTFDLNFATLTSYSQYRKDAQEFSQSYSFAEPDALYIATENHEKVLTQEFLLTSKPRQDLQWTAGAFYLSHDAKLESRLAPGTTYDFFFGGGSRAIAKSMAGYGDVTYEVIDKLFLTAGIRYSHDQSLDNNSILAVNPFTFPDLSSNRVTPRAVIRYAPDSSSSIYASFSQGYKAAMWDIGGPNTTTPIKPETISAFEVGYKYAAQGLSFDLAAYYNNWKDIQVSNFELVGGSALSVITNAAAAHIYGLEGQLRYNITRDFEANVSAAYTHARYASFPDSPAYNQCLVAACGANFGSFVVTPTDATGDTLPRSPSLTSSLGLSYTTPLARGKLGLSGNLYYTSKVYFDTSDQTSQGGYTTLGLRAQWTDPSDRYTIAFYGNNVTNRHYIGELLEITGAIGAVWAAPVTFGGSIRVKF